MTRSQSPLVVFLSGLSVLVVAVPAAVWCLKAYRAGLPSAEFLDQAQLARNLAEG
ncbi:MAG: hypothetical protein GW802_34155, partial [Armatimonadetes bacterium]|nr:hypothetical protein [Armatimonadota bacterium]